MRETKWFTKASVPEYPNEHLPFRAYTDMFVEVPQKESMSGAYPGSHWLCEYELVDYAGSILVPWRYGEPCYGFKMFDTKKEANDHVKMFRAFFEKSIEKHPEVLI